MHQIEFEWLEESDLQHKLAFLHDPYISLDDSLAHSVFIWNEKGEELYLYLWQDEIKKANDVKKRVDN